MLLDMRHVTYRQLAVDVKQSAAFVFPVSSQCGVRLSHVATDVRIAARWAIRLAINRVIPSIEGQGIIYQNNGYISAVPGDSQVSYTSIQRELEASEV